MRSNHESGSVLAADLVLAAAIILVVSATATAFGTVAGAGQDHTEAARNAAVVAARGELDRALDVASRLSPGSEVSMSVSADRIAVRISSVVATPHPVLRWTSLTVRGEAAVPVAPYRSGRG
ncbi:MAG TPA: hypothetical protein DCY40_01920 [Actinobacteria bacterium]|nr:hypothetical protein [Actinomycetota bacterium]